MAKEDIDDERVWHVLEEAQLKDFVKELPGMLDMEIGASLRRSETASWYCEGAVT